MTAGKRPPARPILFNGDMVRAILSGAKTQARRPVAWPVLGASDGSKRRVFTDRDVAEINEYLASKQRSPHRRPRCPFGVPSDLLWVRETWALNGCGDADCCPQDALLYRADGERSPLLKWSPSVHMPRRYSRITLRVTDVRVERVQDISEEDAQAEGLAPFLGVGVDQRLPNTPRNITQGTRPHTLAFASAWDSIYFAKGLGWGANPWAWVVTFEVCK